MERKTMYISFSEALVFLKEGKRVARVGWNGKGMWVWLVQPYAPHPDSGGSAPYCNPYFKAADNNDQAQGTMLPWFGLKAADNGFSPWQPSQPDMLNDDWFVVD